MKISFSQICRDYLALRGESPDLLPLLGDGEESAVLTLRDELRVRIPSAAIKATLEACPLSLDELREVVATPLPEAGGVLVVSMPDDYLKLYSLRMADWKESVRSVEPPGTLRYELGANAPEWMVCADRPMVCEQRNAEGIRLRIFGSRSEAPPGELLYVPIPDFDDGDSLVISASAYRLMLKCLLAPE